MKKLLFLTTLALVTICLQARNIYVQPINGEQLAFSIVENPRITFENGAMSIQGTTFQLNEIQNISFARNVSTNIIWGEQTSPQRVFPNPVADKLHIVHDWQSGDIVELFDMNGRRVFSQPVGAGFVRPDGDTFIIDMSQFPNGTYILRIGNHTLQIIKNP